MKTFIKDEIERFFTESRKPYIVCICGNFKEGEHDSMLKKIQCKNCKGWMLTTRLIDI